MMDNDEEIISSLEDKSDASSDYSLQKGLSIVNKKVNSMNYKQLHYDLLKHRLDTRGNKAILRKRLKAFYKDQRLGNSKENHSTCTFQYLVIIDFEATCIDKNPHNFRHEIIEFPAILLDTAKNEIVDEFHSYVRPVINPMLTPFCTTLTGITQKMVNEAPEFTTVFDSFEEWLSKHSLSSKNKTSFAVVADGPWDMGKFLLRQCKMSNIAMPDWGKRWINIRKIYSNFYGTKYLSLTNMLHSLGLKFEGQLHSGIDDSRNITRITMRLLKDGANLRANEKLMYNHETKGHVVVNSSKTASKKPSANHSSTKNPREQGESSEEPLDTLNDYFYNMDPPIPVFNNNDDFPDLSTAGKFSSLRIN